MKTTAEQFVSEMLRLFPSLTPTYHEHIEDNDEFLSHVFFGDVSREFVSKISAGDDKYVANFLEFIEQSYLDGDEEVQALISLSFVGNLIGEQPVKDKKIVFLNKKLGKDL